MNGSDPLISVIVPVYNLEKNHPTCLESLLAQTYTHLEIVLINDGSTDGTESIGLAYAQRDARVMYFQHPNAGLAETRNIGIAQARGEYCCFVDADDWVEPEYLSYLFDLLSQSGLGASACNHWIHRGSKPHLRFENAPDKAVLKPEETFAHILRDEYPDVSAWGKLYHRSILKNICYPIGRLFEDTYRIAEIILRSGGIVFGNRPQYHYRISTSSLSRGTFDEKKLDYIGATNHMIEVITRSYPALAKAAAARKLHALLSVRRYLVGCSETERSIRGELEKQICLQGKAALTSGALACRERIGLWALHLGSSSFDTLWKVYEWLRQR